MVMKIHADHQPYRKKPYVARWYEGSRQRNKFFASAAARDEFIHQLKETAQRQDPVLPTIAPHQLIRWQQAITIAPEADPVEGESLPVPNTLRNTLRKGILAVMGMTDWEGASAQYRLHLVERGHVEVAGKKGKVSRDLLLATLKQNGQLRRSELLRLRVRYFTDGLVLGTEGFVENVLEQFRSHFGEKRKPGARALREYSGSGLNVIRELRIDPIS
jgi:hypothetical protein